MRARPLGPVLAGACLLPRVTLVTLVTLAPFAVGCRASSGSSTPSPGAVESTGPMARGSASAAPGSARPATPPIKLAIFDHGRKPGWDDWGWAKHEDVPRGEARIDLSEWKGWQLVHQGDVPGSYGGLAFRFRAPASYGTFLTVHLGDGHNTTFPSITIDPAHTVPVDGDRRDWLEAYVAMEDLDPEGVPFDRVVFFVTKNVPADWVSLEGIGLTEVPPEATGPSAPKLPVEDVTMTVDCAAAGTPISPLIYGIAYHFQHDATDKHQWTIGATARRWGGNPTSRYNWQLGNAWNTANDWFFENVNYSGDASFTYRRFLEANRAHHVASVLTIPMLGWVAKDTTSSGFPRAQAADQQAFDQWRVDAGNGMGKDGKPLASGPPTQTSVPAPASFIQKWIEAIVADDKRTGQRSVQEYILDNEPALWNSTHRDVHPDALTYDELLSKTIAVGSAIRAADPGATIAGPAEWGWPNYFYSADDMKRGLTLRLDRRAHGDKPLIAYYLEKLREHEQKTGTRILDVLDLHFYPQGEKVHSDSNDRATADLRVRQTRGLWDETYVDESWIKDTVMLIPRMKKWIAESYPGRGISIGEWNFGGERHPSGGLAVAEALGRFGEQGVTSAFYWTYPPEGSPAYWAFRAYRDYDGKGASFESTSLPAKSSAPSATSVFASRSADGSRVVIVALSFARDVVRRARFDLGAYKVQGAPRVFSNHGRAGGLLEEKVASGTSGPLTIDLAPQSVTVIELTTGR